jgi:ribosomal protein L12E/L44/L45/RPP1/RPP2
MSPSRKTAARSAAASEQPASWHALEVPVPETSRLAPVAGGLPGRVPPQANTLTRSLVAALAEIAACRTGSAWLVAPSRRVGQEWVETVVRLGHPVANLNVTTLPALAFDIVADTLAASGTALAPPRAKLVAVERVLDESRADLESFRDFAGPWRRLAERVLASVEAIRAAGLAAGDVVGGLGRTAKARDLGRILDRYEAALRGLNLVDQPGELALAIDHVAAGRVPPAIALVLVPDDIDPPPLERKLLAALGSAPGVTVRTLATDPPLAAAPAAIDASHVSIFRAAGESNEVRHVLRTAVARGLRFDEIEIVHTDAATYPALVREIVAALPRPAEPAAGHLPVTFAEGLPLADSKPGRALSGWLAWRRDGHPQSGLERLLRDGVIDIAGLVPDAPRSSTLVRALRGVKIGRGLDRTVSMLAAAATRAAEQPAAAFARGWRDDDEPLGDSTPEELAARKARIAGRLSALAALGRVLAQCEGTGAAEPAAVAVLRGARRFVHDLCAADSEFDGNARRMILDEIDAMLTWRGDHGAATAHDMLEWLAHLPEELVVLGSGPRPGCLHVSGLAGGGHSGRPYTFVLGLDENRFPGGGATDPVLTDGDRALLNAAQPLARLVVSRDAAARNLDLWRRLLTRLRGEVWLGFSCRDAADDAEVFPSPALVAYHAQAEGRPLVTVDEFLHTLPPPTALVPADPDLALDESQWRRSPPGRRPRSRRTTASSPPPVRSSIPVAVVPRRPTAWRRSPPVRVGFSSATGSAWSRSRSSTRTPTGGSRPSTPAACSTRCSSVSCAGSSTGRSCPTSIVISPTCSRSSTRSSRPVASGSRRSPSWRSSPAATSCARRCTRFSTTRRDRAASRAVGRSRSRPRSASSRRGRPRPSTRPSRWRCRWRRARRSACGAGSTASTSATPPPAPPTRSGTTRAAAATGSPRRRPPIPSSAAASSSTGSTW